MLRFVERDPAVAQRKYDRLGAVVDREFAKDRRNVILHGLVRDSQESRDLFVGIALGYAI